MNGSEHVKLAKKEYPATHSMETSWFAIDEDGAVAVLHFEENGPVPTCARQDSDIDCEAGEYYFAMDEDDENHDFLSGYMYIYEGSINSEWPLKRICTPISATKENEITVEVRKSAIRLPLKFKDSESIQIAEFVPCRIYAQNMVEINGYYFAKLQTAEGEEAYFNMDKPQKMSIAEMDEYLKDHPRELPKELVIRGKKFHKKANYKRVDEYVSIAIAPYFYEDTSGKETLSAKEVTDILCSENKSTDD